jgi:hypothetical protein
MWEKWNAYRVLVGHPEGKRPLGRYRSLWENNIKMDLRETGWGGMDWIIWLRIGTSGRPCEYGTEYSCFRKCWKIHE